MTPGDPARALRERAVIEPVAVVGAGVMGHGIAQLFATAGAAVRLHDVDPGRLEGALREVERSLRLLVEEGVLETSAAASARARIHPTTDLDAALRGAGLVTECIPEILDAKHALFARVERVVATGRPRRLQHLHVPDRPARRGGGSPGADGDHPLLQPGAARSRSSRSCPTPPCRPGGSSG